MTSRFFGLVPAAGSGSRFGIAGPKQYSLLAGKTMLAYSIERLLAAREVEVVFVVLAPGDTEFRGHDWSAFGERLARARSIRTTGCWCTTRRGPAWGCPSCAG